MPSEISLSASVPLSLVDVNFAKEQLRLFLGHHYLHPSGQMPAYEWNFNDVNPPIHPWAVWTVYNYDKEVHGHADLTFLKFCFEKLSLNFTWWVNRKDLDGNNVFSGGFPRPGQHRGLRPQQPAADGRQSGAIRRHRLDGVQLCNVP